MIDFLSAEQIAADGESGARLAHAPGRGRFHETNVDVTYSRSRLRGDLSLDESFFPVMWDESGYRTWLADLPAIE